LVITIALVSALLPKPACEQFLYADQNPDWKGDGEGVIWWNGVPPSPTPPPTDRW
jgi:hypothetical protein